MSITFHDWDDSPCAIPPASLGHKGNVQIWRAVLPNDPVGVKKISICLGFEEKDRASRYLTKESQLEFVYGRSVLRYLIGGRLGVNPDSLVFGYGPEGKPFLLSPVTPGDLQFNLSHSHGRFVIALCEGRRVGVDIEKVRYEMDWLPVARRYYSSGELRYLLTVPVEHRASAFYRMWTCKEAFLKATGQGLIEDTSDIQVTLNSGLDPELQVSHSGADDRGKWQVRAIPLPLDYVGTIVVEEVA